MVPLGRCSGTKLLSSFNARLERWSPITLGLQLIAFYCDCLAAFSCLPHHPDNLHLLSYEAQQFSAPCVQVDQVILLVSIKNSSGQSVSVLIAIYSDQNAPDGSQFMACLVVAFYFFA